MAVNFPKLRLPHSAFKDWYLARPKTANRFFRLRYMVYPRFQFTMMLINLSILMVAFGIVILHTSRTFEHLRALGRAMRLAPTDGYFRFIEHQASTLYSNLSISFLLALLVSYFVTLIYSHRMAGPVVRLMGYFRGIINAGGVKNPLTFRDGDYFPDLPETVNEALSVVQKGSNK